MLAILGVLVIMGFVILPAILEGMGERKQVNPCVATTAKYGNFYRSNLISLRWQRLSVIRFLESLRRDILVAGGDPMPVQWMLFNMAPGDPGQSTSDEAMVELWLLSRRAEALGLVVDDRTINALLTELMQGRIAPERIPAILERIEITEDNLFAALKGELLAMRLRSMFDGSLRGLTPAQRWDYFQRLNRKVTIELVPVRVADFVDEVAEPDQSTLRELFEKHKAEPYDPTSPDPGFREPKKIAVEYLKAEYQDFFDRERKAVTPEEVKKYYEDHKEDYRQEKLPDLDRKEPPATDAEPGAEPAETTEPEASPKQTTEPEASEKEATEPEASPKQTTEPEASPGEKPSADQQPSTDQEGKSEQEAPFRLASFAEESTAEPTPPQQPTAEAMPAEQPPSAPTPAEGPEAEPAPAEKAAAEVTPAEQPPAAPTPAEGPEAVPAPAEKAAAEVTPAAQPPAEAAPAEGSPAGSAPSQEPASEPTAQPRYLPLEKVEDEIRTLLVREKARDQIERLLDSLRSNKLARYHDELIYYEVHSQGQGGDQTVTPPPRPNFRALATQHGLTARNTGWLSAWDARQLDIGESLVDGETSFLESAFEQLPKHKAAISQDAKGNYYLFWKLDQAEERVPEFEEEAVARRVLHEWKMIEARSRAAQEAERLAVEARKAAIPLTEVFADRSGIGVGKSEPFTWLTYGAIPSWMAQGPPRISEVAGVDTPGDEFMRAVFRLRKGEVGTAMNHPKTAVYVVRVTDSNPLPDVLWSMFTAESYLSYARAAWYDQSLAAKTWLDGIKSEVSFQWDPDWQRQSPQREY